MHYDAINEMSGLGADIYEPPAEDRVQEQGSEGDLDREP